MEKCPKRFKSCVTAYITCNSFHISGGERVSSRVRRAVAAVQTFRQRPPGSGQKLERARDHPEPQRQRPERGTGPQAVPRLGQAQTSHQVPPEGGRDPSWLQFLKRRRLWQRLCISKQRETQFV